ncbi:MAG: L,D-transpeptidase family protein [Nitrospiraceae bacterium]|nr:MAG: L,D-transpeptidase family protein [Nitrospiraceae bacterium]
MKLTFIVILYLLLFLLSAVTVESGSNYTVPSSKVSELIRLHFLSSSSSAEDSLNGSPIHSAEMLRHFYKTRDFQSAWSANAQSFEQARILLNLIEGVQSHGLIPEYYHIDKIKSLIKDSRDAFDTSGLTAQQFAELDILFTDAFLTLGCHFSGGCLAPLIAEAEWHANQDAININAVLETALSENTIQKSLYQLLPLQEGYEKLRKGLQRYRTIHASGGWPKIRNSTILMRGDRTEQIVNLRDRLIASGDMKYNNKENATVFDQEIKNAVIRFQERNGLNPDGIVGPLTIEALNIPVETRIRQIELNLERMRWTSRDTGHRYIMVNIAGFKLDVIENGNKTMSMDVIVGKPYWHTPVLSETMTYIVLNPSWIIPESIAAEEILPKIRENPDYLTMRNIKVMTNWSQDATEINSRMVKWFEIDEDNFHYKLIQQPGTSNPLGNIKFIFPNKYNVYLHDTPGKGLFSRNIRSFSHGCIRIEKPLELAEYLLKENPGWTRNKILSVINKGKAQTVYLPKPIRIHLLYLTAWVDEEDMIQFRNDIYRRDERLYMALLNRPARLTNASKLTFTLH